MYAVLDLVWKPTTADPTPPVGKASAIVRGDTYAHNLRITDGWLDGLQAGPFAAQLRTARLTGSTADAPTASFSVVETQDVDDLIITIGLTVTQTLALPVVPLYWDLEHTSGAVKTTLLSGKVKVLDDVTRAA